MEPVVELVETLATAVTSGNVALWLAGAVPQLPTA